TVKQYEEALLRFQQHPIAQIIEDVRAGKLTAIGVTTPTRSDAAPQISAIAEFVPGYAASGWYGICAPTGTPDDIIEKLNGATTACTDAGNTRLAAPGAELKNTRSCCAHLVSISQRANCPNGETTRSNAGPSYRKRTLSHD